MSAGDELVVNGQDDDDRRRLLVAVVLVALLLLGTLGVTMIRRSAATTTAATENVGNSIEVVSVRLLTDPVAAPFDITDMAPGDRVERCIEVTLEGWTTASGPVRLYLDGYRDPAGLDEHLDVAVTLGPAGTDCDDERVGDDVADGTLQQLATDLVDHPSGAGDWLPAGDSDTRPWWITVTLDREAPPTLMGARVDELTLVWEYVS